MSPHAHLLRQAVLQHAPQRHGLMQPVTSPRKYHETRSAPTEEQLRQHLAGVVTLAAPATSHDLAACIVYDIDGEGLVTIATLLETARQRGLWAWGEWHLATDRGYVWIPFDRLTSAAALAQLGDELAAAVPLSAEQRRTLDNRTANNAITRLPFGRHTHTGQRGDLIMQDGTWVALDADPETALALWEAHYQENPASQVVPVAPATAAPAITSRPKSTCHNNSTARLIPAAGIQQRWNAANDLADILRSKGGRQATRTSWHCPCGQHRNNDHSPSLRICTPDHDRYGTAIVQGYSPSCAFHDRRLVFDAFNVYRILHGLSNTEMLQLARRELGLNPQPQAASRRDSEGGAIQPVHQPAAQPSSQASQAMIVPPQDAPSAATVLTRAGRDSSLSPATRTVLTTILDILSDRPSARIRLATLISQTGLARRTIQAALRRLEAAGYLVIAPQENEYGGHVANQYTLSTGGGRSNRSPLNIKACKGGASAPANAAPMVALVNPAAAPTPAAPPFRVESAPALTAAPVPAPTIEMPPPFHAPADPAAPQADEEATEAASFDPAIYEVWAAALDAQAERPWTYGRSPREVMQSHEYGLAELKRTQTERGPLVTAPALPVVPPAPRLRQSTITVAAPVAVPTAVEGVHGLRVELVRLEREARRYFAQKAPTAGKQTQQRAAAVRRQLAELEGSASGLSAPSGPRQRGCHHRQRSHVQEVLTTE